MDHQLKNSAVWPAAAHNLDFAMQEYLSLQDQHEELSQRLHELSPSSSSSSTTTTLSLASTTATSPSVSPTRSFLGRDGPSSSKLSLSPSTLDCRVRASQNGALVGEVAAGEQKLYDVNEGMKRALTELLNCEAVRQDRAMRTWVQTRLLETEKELRRGRRRRSSATVDQS
ncbi:hypothetical protein F4801DRAFT_581009 [Xylaria longipes]|nr:hypothetical protein F4801DRAFT_581009 [Xylaria longipes]RYC54425.1 hypothetical protein CHU98_g11782 [Xylaria longipes]